MAYADGVGFNMVSLPQNAPGAQPQNGFNRGTPNILDGEAYSTRPSPPAGLRGKLEEGKRMRILHPAKTYSDDEKVTVTSDGAED